MTKLLPYFILFFVTCRHGIAHAQDEAGSSLPYRLTLVAVGLAKEEIDPAKQSPCGSALEIEFLQTPVPYQSRIDSVRIHGTLIARARRQICIPDPVTLEYQLKESSCPNIFVQDAQHQRTWYEIGEGICIEYLVTSDSAGVLLEERRDYFNPRRPLRNLSTQRQ